MRLKASPLKVARHGRTTSGAWQPQQHRVYVLVRSQTIDCCSRMRYDPINNYITAVQRMLEAYALSTIYLPILRCSSVEIVPSLLRRQKMLEGVLCVVELPEAVMKVVEVVLCMLLCILEAVESELRLQEVLLCEP